MLICNEFIDSIMKPGRPNRPPWDTIHHGTVSIPYFRVIPKKFRRTGNRFNVRIVFETKHTLLGTLMETGLVGYAQQNVYIIPCDYGRCYIGEHIGL
jgi:hypothetical protein